MNVLEIVLPVLCLLYTSDIRPTDVAPVIGQSEHGLELGICRWGYRAGEYTQFGVNAIYRRR